MADINTIRILSIDGGGAKGIISATFMKLFVQQWGINPDEIWKYFDVITGTSIGGIQALGYAFGQSPTQLQNFFIDNAKWIFSTSTTVPSSRPSILSKINTIVGGPLSNPTFYPSDVAGIGTMQLKSLVTSVLGTQTLQDAKTNVIITSFEKNDNNPDFAQFTNTPIYFSNSSIVPVLTGQNNLGVDVAMATSAAPLYFPAYSIGTNSYIDGGTVQNNPSSFALAVAQALKPTANRFCILSVGAGLGEIGFPPAPPLSGFQTQLEQEIFELQTDPDAYAIKWNLSQDQTGALQTLVNNLGVLEGGYLIMYLLGATVTGPQEIVAKELEIRDNYTLDNIFNYRMQYYLDPAQDTSLDNTGSALYQYYIDSATSYFNNDITNITNFIAHLTL